MISYFRAIFAAFVVSNRFNGLFRVFDYEYRDSILYIHYVRTYYVGM